MLASLHIRNYVLIDSLDIDFPESLIIITGATGAGKSILLGALGLLLGGKADAGSISEGAESCVVEAQFLSVPPFLKEMIEAEDLEWDGGNLLIRRVVHSTGRSRSFINDCPVNLQFLQQIGAYLVDIHSQHQSLLLKDKLWQLSLLDNFAGNGELLSSCRQAWRDLQAARTSLAAAREALRNSAQDNSYNSERFRRLDEAHLRSGEIAELEEEHNMLSHSSEVKENFSSVLSLCSLQDSSFSSALREAVKHLQKNAAFVASSGELASRLESVRIELDDILDSVEDMASSVSYSPERLAFVEERLSLLYDLLSRYGCSDEAALIEQRERYRVASQSTEELEAEVASLEKKVQMLEKSYDSIAASLSQRRSAAAGPLSSDIESAVRSLELEKARFEIRVVSSEASSTGCDGVEFLFDANAIKLEDVSKCASGGEMSRIMLCLKDQMARYSNMPTLVFDEIDTGVSGSAAAAMGSMICSMGSRMQLISITHLPQVASRGQAHFLVEKDSSGRTGIRRLSGEDRVLEIARLLSGAALSDAALANARVLLSE